MPDKKEYYSSEYPSASNFQWLPWLQKQLLIKDIYAVTPEMPHAYLPDYPIWKREFERFDLTPDTILVGHSCGGGFLVRFLSENKNVKVGKVVLVAPWLDPNRDLNNDFFDFEINPELVSQTRGITIFNSSDDDDDIQISVSELRDKIKDIKYVEFKNYGHFISDVLAKKGFPELLEETLT